MSSLSQCQIDDASPFATPLWMDVPSAEAPAYAGMTLYAGMTGVLMTGVRVYEPPFARRVPLLLTQKGEVVVASPAQWRCVRHFAPPSFHERGGNG